MSCVRLGPRLSVPAWGSPTIRSQAGLSPSPANPSASLADTCCTWAWVWPRGMLRCAQVMSEERNLRDEDPFLGLLVAGRYRVVAPLARGGMGRLYRAVQENLGREIALKILDIQELRDSTGAR